MATNANWTVIFDDKKVIKQSGDGAGNGYKIDNDSFWNDSKWSNIWAIQYIDDNLDHNDTVEYRDDTPHATWNNAGLGEFYSQFVDQWDAAHLAQLQSDWDKDLGVVEDPLGSNEWRDETEAEKLSRLGARPTSYSSS